MDGAELPDLARALLATLLDRAEQPGRRQVARARLSEREHPAYFSVEDATPRQDTNAALSQLAREQVLILHWRRWEEGNWLDAVDLRPAHTDVLYRLLDRSPRGEQEGALRALVAAQTPRSGWHAAFLRWASEQVDAHRAAPPLDRADLSLSVDLLRALAGLAALDTPTLERAMSVRLFGDSKRLAGLRPGLLRVLRNHDPDAALYGDDDDALLRAHQLDRVPEYNPLAGSLTLVAADGRLLTLEPFMPSLALPASLLRAAAVASVDARHIITVENLTSFSELCGIRPPEVLALYTGGFASPTVTGLLRQLREAVPGATHWHWGDLDAGGLRILSHLRAKLGVVGALTMNAMTFGTYCAAAQPLTAGDRASLQGLRSQPLLSDCTELIERLLTTGLKLEQEAVPAAIALAALTG